MPGTDGQQECGHPRHGRAMDLLRQVCEQQDAGNPGQKKRETYRKGGQALQRDEGHRQVRSWGEHTPAPADEGNRIVEAIAVYGIVQQGERVVAGRSLVAEQPRWHRAEGIGSDGQPKNEAGHDPGVTTISQPAH